MRGVTFDKKPDQRVTRTALELTIRLAAPKAPQQQSFALDSFHY